MGVSEDWVPKVMAIDSLDETGHPRGAISRLPVWGRIKLFCCSWFGIRMRSFGSTIAFFLFNFASLYIDLYGFWYSYIVLKNFIDQINQFSPLSDPVGQLVAKDCHHRLISDQVVIGFLRSHLNHRFVCCLALRAAPLMGKQQSLCELWVMATQHGISFLVKPNFGLFLVTLFKQQHPLFSESVNQC